MSKAPVIAVDGPAGSGKSSVARKLARLLGLRYLDSGAMYRAATWKAIREGVDLTDTEALVAVIGPMHVELKATPEGMLVLADDMDVTTAIREPELTANVRYIARNGVIRDIVGRWQRDFARDGGIVAEGRDMTTVIFPDADVKFFVDATVAIRARRRYDELRGRGVDVDLQALELDIAERDRTDIERDVAPLKRAEDAMYIDTGEMTIEQVLDKMISEVESATGFKPNDS